MAGTSAKLKRKPQNVTSSAPAVTQSQNVHADKGGDDGGEQVEEQPTFGLEVVAGVRDLAVHGGVRTAGSRRRPVRVSRGFLLPDGWVGFDMCSLPAHGAADKREPAAWVRLSNEASSPKAGPC